MVVRGFLIQLALLSPLSWIVLAEKNAPFRATNYNIDRSKWRSANRWVSDPPLPKGGPVPHVGPLGDLPPQGPNDINLPPTVVIAKTEILKPEIRKDAKRVRHFIGPIVVPGQDEMESQVTTITYSDTNVTETIRREGVQFFENLSGLCENCTVLAAKADLHFLNGTRVTIGHGIYNHHVVVLDMGKMLIPWYLCDGQTGYGRVFSSGFMITGVAEIKNLFTTPDGKFKSGYFTPQTSKFILNAEIVNYRREGLPIYVTTDIEYLEGKQPDYLDASMSLISVTGCASPDFQPPPGSTHYNLTSPKTKIPIDGYIIGSSGHVHDGGTHILLSLNDKIICDSYATYGGDNRTLHDGKNWETILAMSECNEPVKVNSGDYLTATAVYDTTRHALREAAHGHGDGDSMGTFFINFATKNDIMNQILGSAASLLGNVGEFPLDSSTIQGLDPTALTSALSGIDPSQLTDLLQGFGINL